MTSERPELVEITESSSTAVPYENSTLPDWVKGISCEKKPLDPNPKINLDPERLLIPVLEWGPNNQIRGLMETMLLAIKMNRF